METLTARNFRNRMAASLDRVDAGEQIVFRRRNRLYAVVQVADDTPVLTPQLLSQIEKGRKEHKEGKTLRFNSAAEAQRWMDHIRHL